jgi:hypothetical protein
MFAIALLVGLVCGLASLLAFVMQDWAWLCGLAVFCVLGFALAFRAAYGESQH